MRWEVESHIAPKFWHVPPVRGLEERLQRSVSQRNDLLGSPKKVGRSGVGVLALETRMLPGEKCAVPEAQTPQQPSLGGSLLPSPAAARWQLHLGLCSRAAPSIPSGSGISTHLPRG